MTTVEAFGAAASLTGAGGGGGGVGAASLALSLVPSMAAFRLGLIDGIALSLSDASPWGVSLVFTASGFSALAISFLSIASLAAFSWPAASLAFWAISAAPSFGGRHTSRSTLSSRVPVR